MRFGKDDPLPTGMLIVAACLYIYGHGACRLPAPSACRAALSAVFPMAVEFDKPDPNRVFVTHGRIPPHVRKRLKDALEKHKVRRQHAEGQTGPRLALD